MEDAGSKLLVLPARGNGAAEGAAAELGTPTATLTISGSGGATDRSWASEWRLCVVVFEPGPSTDALIGLCPLNYSATCVVRLGRNVSRGCVRMCEASAHACRRIPVQANP